MASAIRTRSLRRNAAAALSQRPNTPDPAGDQVTTTEGINTTSPASHRSNRRKHTRDASEDIEDLSLSVKRTKLGIGISPVRRNRANNRVVASAKTKATSPEPPSTPSKKHVEEPPPPNSKPKTPATTNGVVGKRERAPISFQDKQVIAQSAARGEGDDGKRKLRSEQGAHYKSELSAYFNEYDEVIGNVVKESQLLSAETQITLVDDSKPKASVSPSKTRLSPLKSRATSPTKSVNGNTPFPTTPREYPDSLFSDLYDTKHFDLGFHLHKLAPAIDPLPDSLYGPAHRRLTRAEKSVRNQDKDRAQHEKDRVIQLLDGLKGHDWLKVLGVTGVTESKKKEFEPARRYFISGCENIIERFRLWKEEEKRRKLEKDKISNEVVEEEEDDKDVEDDISDGDPPDYSDVDASAARQLHDEAVARMTPATPRRSTHFFRPPISPPFKSFFDNPRIREASLRKHRRSTRSEIKAFGQPIPDVEERDFLLSEEVIREGEAARRERDGRTTRRTTRRSGENV